ncbi:MAG: DHH family phosphoesterase [Pseudomonadales bacterium]
MQYFDVFNGDADGICALVQLRNARPLESKLITGVKRDIALLQQLVAEVSAIDEVTVLDVSMDKNMHALQEVLAQGAKVFYCDHHFAGDIPDAENLHALIDTAPDTCTSLLINDYLKGQYQEWAITAAFGDNLRNSALSLAAKTDLSERQLGQLENLGTYINYNGYGASLDDLHFAPTDLYRQLLPYANPLMFIQEANHTFTQLENGYREDMQSAQAIAADFSDASAAVFTFPNAPWARRVSGVYSNDLANAHPDRAHAVLTEKANGCYLVSVRAPLSNKTGADELCMQFPTGGGRKAAAGINDLPAEQLGDFIQALRARYSQE